VVIIPTASTFWCIITHYHAEQCGQIRLLYDSTSGMLAVGFGFGLVLGLEISRQRTCMNAKVCTSFSTMKWLKSLI